MKPAELSQQFKEGFRDGHIDSLFGVSSLVDGETYQAEYLDGYMTGWNRQQQVNKLYREVYQYENV
jgi:hypothetical protein